MYNVNHPTSFVKKHNDSASDEAFQDQIPSYGLEKQIEIYLVNQIISFVFILRWSQRCKLVKFIKNRKTFSKTATFGKLSRLVSSHFTGSSWVSCITKCILNYTFSSNWWFDSFFIKILLSFRLKVVGYRQTWPVVQTFLSSREIFLLLHLI